MDLAEDIHSLTEFTRRTPEFVEQIRRSGRPMILTVDGRAELVVQDAAAYQRLLDLIDQAEALDAIREGMEQAASGRTMPVREALEKLRRKHGIPR